MCRFFLTLSIVLFCAGCEEPVGGKGGPCPEDQPLEDADLPCDCHGATIEALSCGDLICNAVGVTLGDTGGCTSYSTTTSR